MGIRYLFKEKLWTIAKNTCLYLFVPIYKYVSNNQHGRRYRETRTKRMRILKITTTDPSEKQLLVILGSELDVPVRFDFKSKEYSIELASGEEVKTLK